MALQSTVTKEVFGQSVEFENAYHRVDSFGGNKEQVTFKLTTYSEDQLHVIDSIFYDFKPSVDDDAQNIVKQCYEYSKTLEEYSEAIDV